MLKLIVRGDKCKLSVKDSTYYIPIGGFSLPITVDFSECLPVNDISMLPVLTDQYIENLIFDSNFTVTNITTDTA
jgi:hypothetical protein